MRRRGTKKRDSGSRRSSRGWGLMGMAAATCSRSHESPLIVAGEAALRAPARDALRHLALCTLETLVNTVCRPGWCMVRRPWTERPKREKLPTLDLAKAQTGVPPVACSAFAAADFGVRRGWRCNAPPTTPMV
jgi:hypothetical protein